VITALKNDTTKRDASSRFAGGSPAARLAPSPIAVSGSATSAWPAEFLL
jgi:hypothetical protein